MDNQIIHIPQTSIEIFSDAENAIQLEVKLQDEMIWVTAQQMAVLFGRDVKTIRKHINNAKREELAGLVVGAKFASTSRHGAIEGKVQTNPYSNDSRKSHRRKRHHGESDSKSNKSR